MHCLRFISSRANCVSSIRVFILQIKAKATRGERKKEKRASAYLSFACGVLAKATVYAFICK